MGSEDLTGKSDLELRIERLEAVNAVQNLMSRYEYHHSAYQNEKIVPLFADRDDVEIEMVFGSYRGRDAARRFYVGELKENAPPRDLRGEMVEHMLTTPVIEVAGDCRTAKAVWMSPGQEAHRLGWVEGSPRVAFWSYGRYSVDFINTDEGWRLWKVRFQQTFATEYHTSWIEGEAPPAPPTPRGWAAPDGPGRPWGYGPGTEPGLVPEPPVPYDTY